MTTPERQPVEPSPESRLYADAGLSYLNAPKEEVTGWMGLIMFASSMLVMVGGFNFVYGLVAIFDDDVLAGNPDEALLLSVTAWGWLMLVMGTLKVVVGIALLAGVTWARTIGVILAGINVITQMAALSASPIWSSIIIALNVLIIYALTAHGREVASAAE
jgi:hypothetical protein